MVADHQGHILQGTSSTSDSLRVSLTGPAGTGKSQVFGAISEFFEIMDASTRLKKTAPTGVAAVNISGTTIHSEAKLNKSCDQLRSNKKSREALEENWKNTSCLLVDEISFISCSTFGKISDHVSLARNSNIHGHQPFGGIDFIASGDLSQLPPPERGGRPLYDHRISNADGNAQNVSAKRNLSGMLAWRQVDKAVVLRRVMRQRCPIFRALLGRIRFGCATDEDFELLNSYVLTDTNGKRKENGCKVDPSILQVGNWVDDKAKAAPLITFTNDVRDIANYEFSKSFAESTGQEYFEYYSVDTYKKKPLSGRAAQAAWSARPKDDAQDLMGRLPLLIGMPVFLLENVAVELGLANKSEGTIVKIAYELCNGRRQAISVDLDIPSYTNPGNHQHPHRLTIGRVSRPVSFHLPGGHAKYSAARHQLPIIPMFAFTSHSSQGMTLDAAILDLSSCNSVAMAYVMLSRLRSLDGLAILRPFDIKKIRNHMSEGCRKELERLDALADKTSSDAKNGPLSWYYGKIDHLKFIVPT